MTQHEQEDDGPPHQEKKAESWVVTFADMMSLLMSFFVLLLSFSEQDAAKFKEVGGSMEQAFGVQREIVTYQMPKGTSVIAHEFSPGKPKPTVLNEVRQSTIDDVTQTLDFDEKDRIDSRHKEDSEPQKGPGLGNTYIKPVNAQELAEKVSKMLESEIEQGKIQVGIKNQRVIIRILDQGSFASADDSLHPSYEPVLDKIAEVLESVPGEITISGHTDDRPISNRRFRSNWELSAERAITVAHKLYQRGVDKARMVVSGMADTQPLYRNDTEEHRSRNRRVEIVINQNDMPRVQDVPDLNDSEKYLEPADIPKEIDINEPASKLKVKTPVKGQPNSPVYKNGQGARGANNMPDPLKNIQNTTPNSSPATPSQKGKP